MQLLVMLKEFGNPFFNDNCFDDGGVVGFPRSGGYFPCAADGQDTLVAQCPCDIVAAGAGFCIVGKGSDGQAAQQCGQNDHDGKQMLKTFHERTYFLMLDRAIIPHFGGQR